MGKIGEGIKDKLVVTEQSWGCKVQCRKQNNQGTHMQHSWTWTMVWGFPEGVRGAGRRRAKGENGDNCNRIIDKI